MAANRLTGSLDQQHENPAPADDGRYSPPAEGAGDGGGATPPKAPPLPTPDTITEEQRRIIRQGIG